MKRIRRITVSLLPVIVGFLLVSGCASESIPISTTPEAPTQDDVSTDVYRDLVYAEPINIESVTKVLDVYKPIQSGTWPVVVFLHGLNSNKEGLADQSAAIAESGAVVFTPNLPIKISDVAALENGAGFREIYETMACAIRFARANANQNGGDPSRLVLVGFSYGAAYGSWIALGGDNLEDQWAEFTLAGDGPPPQFECIESEGSITVDAFMGISGRYNFAEKFQERDRALWEIASSYAHIGTDPELPIRLLHGERDTIVNPRISVELNDLLIETGYETRLTFFDGIHQVPIDLTINALSELVEK